MLLIGFQTLVGFQSVAAFTQSMSLLHTLVVYRLLRFNSPLSFRHYRLRKKTAQLFLTIHLCHLFAFLLGAAHHLASLM